MSDKNPLFSWDPPGAAVSHGSPNNGAMLLLLEQRCKAYEWLQDMLKLRVAEIRKKDPELANKLHLDLLHADKIADGIF